MHRIQMNRKKIPLSRVHPACWTIDVWSSIWGKPPAPDLYLVVVMVGEALVELLKGKPGQDVLHDR